MSPDSETEAVSLEDQFIWLLTLNIHPDPESLTPTQLTALQRACQFTTMAVAEEGARKRLREIQGIANRQQLYALWMWTMGDGPGELNMPSQPIRDAVRNPDPVTDVLATTFESVEMHLAYRRRARENENENASAIPLFDRLCCLIRLIRYHHPPRPVGNPIIDDTLATALEFSHSQTVSQFRAYVNNVISNSTPCQMYALWAWAKQVGCIDAGGPEFPVYSRIRIVHKTLTYFMDFVQYERYKRKCIDTTRLQQSDPRLTCQNGNVHSSNNTPPQETCNIPVAPSVPLPRGNLTCTQKLKNLVHLVVHPPCCQQRKHTLTAPTCRIVIDLGRYGRNGVQLVYDNTPRPWLAPAFDPLPGSSARREQTAY